MADLVPVGVAEDRGVTHASAVYREAPDERISLEFEFRFYRDALHPVGSHSQFVRGRVEPDRRDSIVNNAIVTFGGDPIFFMGAPEWFRPLYIGSDIWQNAGFSMIVYLAALTAIDPALHEAARVDGANKWQRIRHIDIPGIMPVITILFILAIGNLFNLGFEKVLIMQTDLNLPTSEVIQTYVYKAGLQQAQFSYSAAIGLFNSLINLALLMTFNWVARRAGQSSLW